MPEPASSTRMPPVVSSCTSMHGVLQPWIIPSGTDHGTDPLTPRNLTRTSQTLPATRSWIIPHTHAGQTPPHRRTRTPCRPEPGVRAGVAPVGLLRLRTRVGDGARG